MLQAILLVVLIFVCIALIAVILLQQSEGGALGMGGGPSGFMTARGAGDLLSRTTGILAAVFFALCIGLTLIIGHAHKGNSVVDRLKIQGVDPNALKGALAPPPATNTTGPAAPVAGAPLLLEAPKPEVHGAPAPTPLAPAPAVPAPTVKKAAPAKAPPAATPPRRPPRLRRRAQRRPPPARPRRPRRRTPPHPPTEAAPTAGGE